MKSPTLGIIATACLVAFLTLSVVPAVGWLSSPSRADPTCSPWYYPSYTVNIFRGKGHIHDVNLGLGTTSDYYNGATVTLKVCGTRYSSTNFQAVVSDSSLGFREWVTQSGSFSSETASSTTFYPAHANGYQGLLSLILSAGTSVQPTWGGYQFSGSGFTNVMATISVPSASYWNWCGSCQDLVDSTQVLRAGVALGDYPFGSGLTGLTNTMTAGVEIDVSLQGITSYQLYEWQTVAGSSNQYGNVFHWPASNIGGISLWDNVRVDLYTFYGYTYAQFTNLRTGITYNAPPVYFLPGTSTAGWLVTPSHSSATGSGFSFFWQPLPSNPGISFTQPSSQTSTTGAHNDFNGPGLKATGTQGVAFDVGGKWYCEDEVPMAFSSSPPNPTSFAVGWSTPYAYQYYPGNYYC